MIPIGLVGRRSSRGLDVFVGEAEADHAADPAAVRRRLQHLLARIGEVAGRIEPRYRRLTVLIGLDEIPEPGRMRSRLEAERGERFGSHPERGADHHRVSVDAVAALQLDRGNVAIVAGDNASDSRIDDVHPCDAQRIDLRARCVDAVVQHDGEAGTQLAEQTCGVKTPRVGDDLDDASVADFEAVAERAMDDIAAPVFGETLDVGKVVDEARGGEHPSGDHRMTADELDAEAAVVEPSDVDGTAGEHLDTVAANLLAPDRCQLCRWEALVAEVAVHVGGRGVARLARVDHDDRPALTAELQGGGEARR